MKYEVYTSTRMPRENLPEDRLWQAAFIAVIALAVAISIAATHGRSNSEKHSRYLQHYFGWQAA